jgi:hypothetical protein
MTKGENIDRDRDQRSEIELYIVACDRRVFLKTIIQMLPMRTHKIKPSPTWMGKSYRLTKFLPKIRKNQLDERSSQHSPKNSNPKTAASSGQDSHYKMP